MVKTKSQKKAKKKLKKAEKKLVQLAVKPTKLTGHGDYKIKSGMSKISGHGDYFGDLLGSVGSNLGRAAAGGIGSLFKSITGMGDYRQRAAQQHAKFKAAGNDVFSLFPEASNPSSLSMGTTNASFGGKPPRVCHREMIARVNGSTEFKTTSYRIQPGINTAESAFPWGSSVAKCFTQYKLNGCIFEFVSTKTTYSSTGTLGSVYMSTQYDVNAPPLGSSIAVGNNEFTTTDNAAQSFIHPIECAPEMNSTMIRYVRKSNSITDSPSDDRLDDVGNFQFSTEGCPDESEIGQLWVTYDIEYLKPALPDYHEGTAAVFVYDGVTSSGFVDLRTVNVNPNNSLPVIQARDPLNNGVVLRMPAGYAGSYYLHIGVHVSSTIGGVLNGSWDISGSSVIPGKETEIVPVDMFYQYDASWNLLPSNGFPVINYGTSPSRNVLIASCMWAFKTVASNSELNYINVKIPWVGAATDLKLNVQVIAMDSDFKTALNSPAPDIVKYQELTDLKVKQMSEKIARLEKLLIDQDKKDDYESDTEQLDKSIHISKADLSKLLGPSSVPLSLK